MDTLRQILGVIGWIIGVVGLFTPVVTSVKKMGCGAIGFPFLMGIGGVIMGFGGVIFERRGNEIKFLFSIGYTYVGAALTALFGFLTIRTFIEWAKSSKLAREYDAQLHIKNGYVDLGRRIGKSYSNIVDSMGKERSQEIDQSGLICRKWGNGNTNGVDLFTLFFDPTEEICVFDGDSISKIDSKRLTLSFVKSDQIYRETYLAFKNMNFGLCERAGLQQKIINLKNSKDKLANISKSLDNYSAMKYSNSYNIKAKEVNPYSAGGMAAGIAGIGVGLYVAVATEAENAQKRILAQQRQISEREDASVLKTTSFSIEQSAYDIGRILQNWEHAFDIKNITQFESIVRYDKIEGHVENDGTMSLSINIQKFGYTKTIDVAIAICIYDEQNKCCGDGMILAELNDFSEKKFTAVGLPFADSSTFEQGRNYTLKATPLKYINSDICDKIINEIAKMSNELGSALRDAIVHL